MRRPWVPWLCISALVVMGLSGYLVAWWMTAPLTTGAGPAASQVIDIPEGATFRQVATALEQEGIIRSRLAFTLLGRLSFADRRVIPGEYEVHSGMRPREILAKLRGGQVLQYPVTIPEGYTLAQIAALLQDKGLAEAPQFLNLAQNRDFILTAFQLDLGSLEGYLFPNTYHFPRGTKAADMIIAMVDELWRVFTPAWRARAAEIHLSVHEVLTLASVIEKETGAEEERELISSVFHNRLQKRIPLQSDPTVIYGLSAFDGNLRRRDLERVTPYNTYRVAGLPPGPIANPGARSIHAALFPTPTRYLYFVSKNDGTHHFSSTLAEHNEAVDKYQRRPARTSNRG